MTGSTIRILLADAVVASHLTFIGFVLAGGFLSRRWPGLVRWHLVAVAVTAVIFLAGLDCPLTSIEKDLRRAGGQSAYSGSFVNHYLVRPLPGINSGAAARLEPFLVVGLVAAGYAMARAPVSRRRRA